MSNKQKVQLFTPQQAIRKKFEGNNSQIRSQEQLMKSQQSPQVNKSKQNLNMTNPIQIQDQMIKRQQSAQVNRQNQNMSKTMTMPNQDSQVKSQEFIIKRQQSPQIVKQKYDMPNPEEEYMSARGRNDSYKKEQRARDESQKKEPRARDYSQKKEPRSTSREVETQIREMINQQYPNYQHQDASCVCPSCLCGKCVCKVKSQQKMYPKNMKSIYQQEYPWKEGDNDDGMNPSQYDNFKGNPYSLNKESSYRQDYQPFKVQNNKVNQKDPYVRNNYPFQSSTQYNRDYVPFGASRSIAMRPLDQMANPHNSDLPHMLGTTYRSDFKKFPQQGEQNFENNSRYKLHTNAKQPNLYMNTTYQDHYIKREGLPSKQSNQAQSNMPLGLGQGSYRTIYRDNYVPMEIRKCPARETLEQICDHTMNHGMNYTKSAVSQISTK